MQKIACGFDKKSQIHVLKAVSEKMSKDFSMHDKRARVAQIVFVKEKSQYNDI